MPANWNNPILTDTYSNFLDLLKARDVDAATMAEAPTNPPTGYIRWNATLNKFQKWSGAAWVDLVLATAGGGTGATSLGTMAAQNATAVAITGGTINAVEFQYHSYLGISPPTLSAAGKAKVYFDSASNKLKVSVNGGAYANFLVAGIAPAADVVNTPAGNISSTNVQAAINELDTEKQSKQIVESHGGTIVNGDGIGVAINVIAWIAPYACTVTAVKGYRVGGTGATVNARKNGVGGAHLASHLSLTSADTWMDGGAVQNTSYAAGDKMEIMIVTATGSPTQLGVSVYFTRV